MAVRKRLWTNDKGEHREAWVVDYSVNGKRHTKTFERKRDADRYHAGVTVDVGKGVHTPESRSLTVAQAAEQWLAYVELEGLTLDHRSLPHSREPSHSRGSAPPSWQR